MNGKKRRRGDGWFYALSLIWPARCPVCGKITQQRARLCKKCEAENEALGAACIGCGLPPDKCTCLKDALDLNLAVVYPYRGGIRKAIHAMKFYGRSDLFDFFGVQMAERFRAVFPDAEVDLVAAVPMTRRSRKKREYNQSVELAKRVARQLGVKYGRDTLEKIRETDAQHTLSEKQRRKNVKGAFRVNPSVDLRGKTVLLCDDIKTTGATLTECRSTLLGGGAEEVYCVAAAATMRE